MSKESGGRNAFLAYFGRISGNNLRGKKCSQCFSVCLEGSSVIPVQSCPTLKTHVVLKYSKVFGMLYIYIFFFLLSTDAAASTAPVPTAEVGASQEDEQVFEPADTLPSRSEAAAVQPVIGISQRVQMNSREKKDLGTLGTKPGSCDGSIPVIVAGQTCLEALKAALKLDLLPLHFGSFFFSFPRLCAGADHDGDNHYHWGWHCPRIHL